MIMTKIGDALKASKTNLTLTVKEGNDYTLKALRRGYPCGCYSDELMYDVGLKAETDGNPAIGDEVRHKQCGRLFKWDGIEWVNASLFE